MGSCEADYCFTERKPTEVPGVFRITKGCLKRPSRTHHGCDFDHFPDHIQCVCTGEFCNDAVYIRPQFRRNITCRHCGERDPDCSDTCQGQWCHEDASTGVTGCGYVTNKVPLHTCVSCDITAQDNAMTSSCKQQHCVGHYCTLATQRIILGGNNGPRIGAQAIIHEKQGCINVTDNLKIQLGCSHKWMNNQEEELLCACVGENCNKDLTTASLSGTDRILLQIPVLISYFVVSLLYRS
ncbi:hypothetical protein FO519_008661 [Halicephalobus sp. NKZ332]|nr:hypothetical protein FO519_008661 [Halicephalobus sp. NKZ332]